MRNNAQDLNKFNYIPPAQLQFMDVTRPFLQQAPPNNSKRVKYRQCQTNHDHIFYYLALYNVYAFGSTGNGVQGTLFYQANLPRNTVSVWPDRNACSDLPFHPSPLGF